MPAKQELTVTGNAKEVIEATAAAAVKVAETGKLEQESLQIVLPSIFGMVRIRTTAEIGSKSE